MTGSPDTVILAHHSLLLAIPAFLPAVLVAGVVVYIAMRDRRSDNDSDSESTDSHRKDDSA